MPRRSRKQITGRGFLQRLTRPPPVTGIRAREALKNRGRKRDKILQQLLDEFPQKGNGRKPAQRKPARRRARTW